MSLLKCVRILIIFLTFTHLPFFLTTLTVASLLIHFFNKSSVSHYFYSGYRSIKGHILSKRLQSKHRDQRHEQEYKIDAYNQRCCV